MPISLIPKAAADLAATAYEYVDITQIEGRKELPLSLGNDFEFSSKQVIQGTTGILFARRKTGFAITAKGTSLAYHGHHIIAFRGTVFECKPDVITDIYLDPSISRLKKIVHGGFERTFNSMAKQIADYIRVESPVCVHVIGHSLGGALANLAACFIQQKFGLPVKLYTFGAPRVGLLDYAKDLNSNGYIDHLRVTHANDPVTAIPVWPFVHAGDALQVAGSDSQLYSVEAHGVTPNTGYPGYTASAGSHKSFFDMQVKVNRLTDRMRVILFYENRFQTQCTSEWESKIRLCLQTLLYDAGYVGTVFAQAAVAGIETVYDLIARSLEKIAQTAEHFADRVKGLLGHMLAFVGQAGRTIKKLSYTVIREIFALMLKTLARLARDAISRHM